MRWILILALLTGCSSGGPSRGDRILEYHNQRDIIRQAQAELRRMERQVDADMDTLRDLRRYLRRIDGPLPHRSDGGRGAGTPRK